MNFSDFCDNNQNMKKYEKNFQKNDKNMQKNSNFNQNNQNFNDLSNNSQSKQNQIFENETLKNDIEQKIKKYQNLSQSELLNELLKETAKQKQNGNFDTNQLEEIKNSLLPMLDENQKQRLEQITKMLKWVCVNFAHKFLSKMNQYCD